MQRNDSDAARAPSGDDAQVHPSVSDRYREFEALVENLEEMIVVVDRDYRYRMANQAYPEYRGGQRAQIVGHLASEIVSPENFQRFVKPKLDECFQQNRVFKFELTANSPSLGVRDLLVSYFPICGPAGGERVASITQDIAERKRAHELIREERDRAQSYLDIADVILLALDLEGRITLNRKGCATLGRKQSELRGRNWVDTCLPPRIQRELKAFSARCWTEN